MNIKSKLLFLVVVCSLLPILVISTMSYISTQKALEKNISEQVASSTEEALSKIDGTLNASIMSLNAWGSSMVMQDIAIDDLDGAISNHLKGLTNYFPYYAEAITLNGQGVIIASTLEKNMGLNLSSDEWVQKTLQGESFQGVVSISLPGSSVYLSLYRTGRYVDYRPD